MKAIRTHRAMLPAAVLWLALAACARLQPVPLPPETAMAPSDAPVWEAVGAVRSDDWLVLLNDGPRALDLRLTAIDTAVESIDLQTFLWEPDTTGAMVVDHLVAAADRGVRVRFLIDDSFLLGKDELILTLHRHPNVEYRIFNPYGRRSSKLAARELLNLAEFWRLDHRMHNKAMIVDGRLAIVGGRNLSDDYFGLHPEHNFRDLELLVAGPVVARIGEAFDRYWNDRWAVPVDALAHVDRREASLEAVRRVAAAHPDRHGELDPSARTAFWKGVARSAHGGRVRLLVDDPPGLDPSARDGAPVQLAAELSGMLDGARWEIVIASAYLVPTAQLEDAVRRAVSRGVSVRMLTNSLRSNNHLAAHSAYRNHIRTLLGHGASLHEVRIDARDRGLYMLAPIDRKTLSLHAKALVVDDDRVFIGSANLDPRSMRINTEMGLLVESRSLNAALRNALDVDFRTANAWRLQLDGSGRVLWVSDRETRTRIPAASPMQNLADWFFGLLPIEEEM